MSYEQPWRWYYTHNSEAEHCYRASHDGPGDRDAAVALGLASADRWADGCGVWVLEARMCVLPLVDLYDADYGLDFDDGNFPSAEDVLDRFAEAHGDLWGEDGWDGAGDEADLQRRLDAAPRTVEGLNAAFRAWFEAHEDELQETVFVFAETRNMEQVRASTEEA